MEMKASTWAVIVGVSLTACSSETPSEAPPPEEEPEGPNLGHSPKAEPPAHVVGGFSIELPETVLEPGDEKFPCWVFPLELTGPSLIVGGGKMTTTAGMHHGNVTTRPITGEGIRPCEGGGNGEFGGEATDILAGGAVLFGSSTQVTGEEWQSFPDGMGFPIAEGYEIVARMHYLNTTAETLTVAPTYEWFTIDESTVEKVLGPFAWVLTGWEIPPLSKHTVTGTCANLPGPMQVVNAMPHMHALGTEFFGEYIGGELDGTRWLDSKGYDPDGGVITQYTPAIDLGQGEGFTFGCTWENTYDKAIGEGVGDDEMCILFGYGYPYENAYSGQATDNGGCVLIAPPPPGG
jgi:hypothetical protein